MPETIDTADTPVPETQPETPAPTPATPAGKFQLPLTLVCKTIDPTYDGGPVALDCVVTDATGRTVRAPGQMQITTSPKGGIAHVSSVLQSYADTLTKELVAKDQAELVELSEEDSMQSIEAVIGRPFVGVAK